MKPEIDAAKEPKIGRRHAARFAMIGIANVTKRVYAPWGGSVTAIVCTEPVIEAFVQRRVIEGRGGIKE